MRPQLLVSPPISGTMHSTKSCLTISNSEWQHPEKYNMSYIIIANRTIWTTDTYTAFKDIHIKDWNSLPSRYNNVPGYPHPCEITRYRSIPKYKKFTKAFLKVDKAVFHWSKQSNLKSLYKTWKTTCRNLLQNPYFREHWRVPALASWYHQDVQESTKGFIHSMFRSDRKIEGKMGRSAVLSKHAFLDIDNWISKSRDCQHEQIPFPKCNWFHKLRRGHYNLALSQFDGEPQASISMILKKV